MTSQSDHQDEAEALAAYDRWRRKHGEAARAIEAVRGQDMALPYDKLEALKQKYPEAMSEYIGLALYSPDVIRKMRRQEPGWRPPDVIR